MTVLSVFVALLVAALVYLVLLWLPGIPAIICLIIAVIVFLGLLFHPFDYARYRR